MEDSFKRKRLPNYRCKMSPLFKKKKSIYIVYMKNIYTDVGKFGELYQNLASYLWVVILIYFCIFFKILFFLNKKNIYDGALSWQDH